jgi:hypothetical protein
LAPAIINQAIDGYVTPRAVANVIRTGKPSENDTIASQQPRQFSLKQVNYAFFSGGPFTFKVEIFPENDRPIQSPVTLLFRWSGDWKLTRIVLPADAMDPVQRSVAAKDPNPGSPPQSALTNLRSRAPPPPAQALSDPSLDPIAEALALEQARQREEAKRKEEAKKREGAKKREVAKRLEENKFDISRLETALLDKRAPQRQVAVGGHRDGFRLADDPTDN